MPPPCRKLKKLHGGISMPGKSSIDPICNAVLYRYEVRRVRVFPFIRQGKTRTFRKEKIHGKGMWFRDSERVIKILKAYHKISKCYASLIWYNEAVK